MTEWADIVMSWGDIKTMGDEKSFKEALERHIRCCTKHWGQCTINCKCSGVYFETGGKMPYTS